MQEYRCSILSRSSEPGKTEADAGRLNDRSGWAGPKLKGADDAGGGVPTLGLEVERRTAVAVDGRDRGIAAPSSKTK